MPPAVDARAPAREQTALARARADRRDAERARRRLERQFEAAHTEVESLQDQLARARAQLAAAERSGDELRKRLLGTEAKLDRARVRLARMRASRWWRLGGLYWGLLRRLNRGGDN
jgi:uncharacterized protein YhaN